MTTIDHTTTFDNHGILNNVRVRLMLPGERDKWDTLIRVNTITSAFIPLSEKHFAI